MYPLRPVLDTIKLLRTDAIERGFDDLAIAYGWSAIRLGREIADMQYAQMALNSYWSGRLTS